MQALKKVLVPAIDKLLLTLSLVLLFLLIWILFVDQKPKPLYDLLYIPIWLVFIIEYCIKVFLVKNKLAYIRNDFFGILIVIFPFLRPLRLFPASRFGLLIITEQINDRLPWIKKYRILEILLFGILILILSSDLLLLFENVPHSNIKTFSDALWFSISTVSTTGYGEFYPITAAGRVVTTFLLIFGISAFGIITAKVVSIFVDTNVRKELRAEDKKIESVSEEEKKIEGLVDKVISEEESIKGEISNLKKPG